MLEALTRINATRGKDSFLRPQNHIPAADLGALWSFIRPVSVWRAVPAPAMATPPVAQLTVRNYKRPSRHLLSTPGRLQCETSAARMNLLKLAVDSNSFC